METIPLETEKLDEMSDFRKFLTTLSENLDKTLNPDGTRRIGFACFLFSTADQAKFASMIRNVPPEQCHAVIKTYLAKDKQDKLKKARRTKR